MIETCGDFDGERFEQHLRPHLDLIWCDIKLVDPETRPRRQQRGTSIRGGYRREIGPGDVVHIPVGVPHQLILPEGETFLYDLTKFDEEPLGER